MTVELDRVGSLFVITTLVDGKIRGIIGYTDFARFHDRVRRIDPAIIVGETTMLLSACLAITADHALTPATGYPVGRPFLGRQNRTPNLRLCKNGKRRRIPTAAAPPLFPITHNGLEKTASPPPKRTT